MSKDYPIGIRKKFAFPSADKSWLPEDGKHYLIEEYPKLYGVIGDVYNDTSAYKLEDPGFPYASGLAVAFSRDSKHLVLGHDGGNKIYLQVYENNFNGTFRELAKPVSPGDEVNSVAFSPDGVFLAVAWGSYYNTSNNVGISIYRYNKGSLSKLDDIGVLGGTGRGVCFSPDGKYLIVTHGSGSNNGNYLSAWRNNNNVSFTRLDHPAGLGGEGTSVTFSPDGDYFAVISYSLIFYRNNRNDTFTKLAATEALAGRGTSVVFSPDGDYLAAGFLRSGNEGVSVYQRPFTFEFIFSVPYTPASEPFTINHIKAL